MRLNLCTMGIGLKHVAIRKSGHNLCRQNLCTAGSRARPRYLYICRYIYTARVISIAQLSLCQLVLTYIFLDCSSYSPTSPELLYLLSSTNRQTDTTKSTQIVALIKNIYVLWILPRLLHLTDRSSIFNGFRV